jgi:hypothetical protein
VFTLTNREGKLLKEEAKPGDYICINIPWSRQYNWQGQRLGAYRAHRRSFSSDDVMESFGMQVRPSPRPEDPVRSAIAHFFSRNATSSFIIERNGCIVNAEVHGRNEKPNIHTGRLLDNIRNAIAGTLAIAGFSKLQWSELVRGLVNTEIEA